MSGLRACTAAPIEISYSSRGMYTAEVEFLSATEWFAELKILVDELTDEDGRLNVNMRRPSSETGRIAFDKITSVYGVLATYDKLIRNTRCNNRLGSVKKFQSPSPKGIRIGLEQFVSSRNQQPEDQYRHVDSSESIASLQFTFSICPKRFP